ncbi:hypothetical protein C8R48DRAFT_731485 [Suillus tomentosus]|nr:hypothetical protein C8R48DRAFT_731485 [Suillus tomentosus]
MLGFQKLLCYVTLSLPGRLAPYLALPLYPAALALRHLPAKFPIQHPVIRLYPNMIISSGYAPRHSHYSPCFCTFSQFTTDVAPPVVPLMLPGSSLPSFCNRFSYLLVLTWLLHIIRSSGVSVLPLFCSAYPGPDFPMVPPIVI